MNSLRAYRRVAPRTRTATPLATSTAVSPPSNGCSECRGSSRMSMIRPLFPEREGERERENLCLCLCVCVVRFLRYTPSDQARLTWFRRDWKNSLLGEGPETV